MFNSICVGQHSLRYSYQSGRSPVSIYKDPPSHRYSPESFIHIRFRCSKEPWHQRISSAYLPLDLDTNSSPIMSECSLTSLPEAILHPIVSYLEAPEILQFLSCSRQLRQLGANATFWTNLASNIASSTIGHGNIDQRNLCTVAKRHFLQAAYCRLLPRVQFKSLRETRGTPSDREGHLACVLPSTDDQAELLLVAGGFANDDAIYVKNLAEATDWITIQPSMAGPLESVYGASLTTLDATRVIRFGGFRSGGYSNETHHVAVLTMDYENRSANWTLPAPSFGAVLPASLSRAYHTATLLLGRYLIILGGMKSHSSTMYPVCLDTHTWRWHEVITTGDKTPSERHGHSTIWDERNNRLVVFGGGSGSDLLRSGTDNAQVWELKLSNGWQKDILGSFPWTWRLIHDEPDFADDNSAMRSLSPSESLVLGRCHVAHRVSPTTAVLLFGSGRPSTNGLIAYNLQSDTFLRPRIGGGLPMARLSAASVYLEKQSSIFVHGGYSTQLERTITSPTLLNLTPMLALQPDCFHGMVTARPSNHPAITNEQALAERNVSPYNHMEQIMHELWAAEEAERPRRAAEMLANNDHNERAAMLLSFLAAGRIAFRAADEEDEEDEAEDGDDNYEMDDGEEDEEEDHAG